jgi:FkbM family methyltransferase
MFIRILYGIKEDRKDVTDICLAKLVYNNIITIPKGDGNRAMFFNDHLPGVEKRIFVIHADSESEYDVSCFININTDDFTINTINDNDINNKLNAIHSKLKIQYGGFNEELPEQQMTVAYLTGNEKVLEIGGNIGRNSLVIASIINNENLVTLETDQNIAKQLEENRNLNNCTFHIENAALSKRKLIQSGWYSFPSDVLYPGHILVNTISLAELKIKYPINFDTLVLDCEGAFYYILMDMPEILDGIKLVIMENDYGGNIAHKNYVDSVLKKYNFNSVYREAGGWGCCEKMFYEVWLKATG